MKAQNGHLKSTCKSYSCNWSIREASWVPKKLGSTKENSNSAARHSHYVLRRFRKWSPWGFSKPRGFLHWNKATDIKPRMTSELQIWTAPKDGWSAPNDRTKGLDPVNFTVMIHVDDLRHKLGSILRKWKLECRSKSLVHDFKELSCFISVH